MSLNVFVKCNKKKHKKHHTFCKQSLETVDAKKDVLMKFGFKDKIGRLKRWANSGEYKIDYKYYDLRYQKQILDKDICQVCCKEKAYCMHHILLLCKGGNNKASNLIAICEKCHKKIHPYMKSD